MVEGSFIAAHWMFASEYYKISCQMPFVVKDDVVPEDMIKKNNRHYKVIMVIIIVTFLLHGLFDGLQAMIR